MAVQSLNHVTLRPRDMEATRDFYVDVIGLRDGERPLFHFAGYWLYAGEAPVIHLVDKKARRPKVAAPNRTQSRPAPIVY